MQTEQIVALLVQERDRLSRAIEALQGPIKRRGRPPKNPLANASDWVLPSQKSAPRKARRKFTAEQRQAQAEKMKAYWAKKKKAAKK
jgi:hypothetical protein